MVWKRIDAPGHEWCRLLQPPGGWRLAGCAIAVLDDAPVRLDYDIGCDALWRTRSVAVAGWIGTRRVSLALARDENDRWTVNGLHDAALDGCVDVDLSFSPATNLLPIRRLAMAPGDEAAVGAAWVRLPDLSVTVLEQTYRCLEPGRFAYESNGGAFQRELTVDTHGFVREYPELWEAES